MRHSIVAPAFVCLCLVSLACLSSRAFAENPQSLGCVEGNCISGSGVLVTEQSRYEGKFSQSLYHGMGTLSFFSGETIVGHFVEGQPMGMITQSNAARRLEVRVGQDFLRYGPATMTLVNGAELKFEFFDGQPGGKGTLTLATGKRFKGSMATAPMARLIVPDSQAQRLGVALGDVLLSYASATLVDQPQVTLIEAVQQHANQIDLSLIVLRNGTQIELLVAGGSLGIGFTMEPWITSPVALD